MFFLRIELFECCFLLLSIVKDETTFIRQTCYLKFWRLLFVVTMKRATLT